MLPFYNCSTLAVLTGGQGNDCMTFTETPINEKMNSVLIKIVGRAVATAGSKTIKVVFMKDPRSLKIRAECAWASNDIEIGIGRLFN